LLYGLYAILAGLFRRPGIWDFLKERTKRRHQLEAEEAQIGAIHQLLPKLPEHALVVQVGADGYFIISTAGAPPIPEIFTVKTPPPGVDGSWPAQIEAESEPAQETDG
jgi:hypothetical protein